ncbi:Uncharacterised protein [Bartonella vinsonii]|uniref:Uncharacterized protein n=1 Tax=Bartonella vinsonii TaxID=33047 RepID=A0A3S5F8Y1_BARVI|nr:Uncharacterised protein [Bartonella vinsonii]
MTYASNKTGIYGAVNVVYTLYDHFQRITLLRKLKECYAVRSFPFGEDKAFCFARHIECKN